MSALRVCWMSQGVPAECPPDPAYPDGIALDMRTGTGPSCEVNLDYPAPCVGMWCIECPDCRKAFIVTAAGRVDDPVSVTVSCGKKL